jgi:O-acetyl-ADP-ribose deacetylase (regulator of RNase III)
MLEIIEGNIFNSRMQTLVNTVNCEGVMGAGLALECRLRYPQMYDRYQTFCAEGTFKPGKLSLYKGHDRWLLNFPTKLQWRQPSEVKYLEQGLRKFAESWQKLAITGIAFPLLGTDKGGLPEKRVIVLMTDYLTPIAAHIPVEIYRYRADAEDDLFSQFRQRLQQISLPELAEATEIQKHRLERLMAAVSQGEVCQINQLANIQGIGLKTLEKVFHYCTDNTLQIQPELF